MGINGGSKELAANHYRVRVQIIEGERPVDFEWRTDVLYLRPKAYPSKRSTTYVIQLIDKLKRTYDIALLNNKTEAKDRYKSVKKELTKICKEEFEEKYGMSKMVQEGDSGIEKSRNVGDLQNRMDEYGEAIIFAGEVKIDGQIDGDKE